MAAEPPFHRDSTWACVVVFTRAGLKTEKVPFQLLFKYRRKGVFSDLFVNFQGFHLWGRILGRNWDKSLSFPPCYSRSPLLMDFTPPPLPWSKSRLKLVWNVNIAYILITLKIVPRNRNEIVRSWIRLQDTDHKPNTGDFRWNWGWRDTLKERKRDGRMDEPVELRGLRLSRRKTFSTLGVAICSISPSSIQEKIIIQGSWRCKNIISRADIPQSHKVLIYIYIEPQCRSPRQNWDSPNPSPAS